MSDINLIPAAMAMLVASGFLLAWGLPFYNLLKERLSDFVAAMLFAVVFGRATWAFAFEVEIGLAIVGGIFSATAFGLVLGVIARTVYHAIRD